MSEMSDAIVVVVSEETGFITICRNGRLDRGLSLERLREYLTAELTPEKTPDQSERLLDRLIPKKASSAQEDEKHED